MKTGTILLLGALPFAIGSLPLLADEGMWPYGQFPKDTVAKKYNVQVSDEFLDNLRQATVRIGNGGGSFVSPAGLIVTNQHLVTSCLAAAGNAQHNYTQDGFYAASQSAEIACPGMTASVLTTTEDVTKQVTAGTKEGSQAASAIQQRLAAITRIEKECADKTKSRCEVVKLYSGVRYDLYQYKQYTDLRLVFAPERQIAFFGAERDTITYLRYGMDLAFLRAYENGKPAAISHYLKWNVEGVKDGDMVISAGNPQPTSRLSTASQINFYRQHMLPTALARLQSVIGAMTAFSAKTEENNKAAQPVFADFVLNYKLVAGKLIGLNDDRMDAVKKNFESKIRNAVEKDPKLGEQAARVWDDVTMAYKEWQPYEKPYQILEENPAMGSVLFKIARQLVRPTVQGAAILDASAPNDALEAMLLSRYLEELKALGDKESPIKTILGGKTSDQVAEEIVKQTKLKDPAERKRLAASAETAQKSDDALIKLVMQLEPASKNLRKKHEDMIDFLEVSASEKIAQYRLKLFGATEYPDATGTPRLLYGVVKGYTDRAGVPAAYASTFGGLYYRRNNEGPYAVPQHWVDLRNSLELVTPLNFVSTSDIGGGDYGSPVVNKDGQLVGITFDGNLESLPDTYLYTDDKARAVHVATQGVVQALSKAYNADSLLRELGVSAPTSSSVGQ